MTREEYIGSLRDTFATIEVLSTKNECKVLKLRHRKTGKDLVLRSYPQQLAAYDALVKIRCTNLPEILDTIPMDDGQIVLEEYIPGMTVAQIMKTNRYQKQGARHIMAALCHAMSVLHARGLVHRDIKPENVMISDNGRVVLIDFNASRQVGEGSHDTVIMGTVGYVSPEQLGLSQTDSRTDIYAAGVLYNVMLTGLHPSMTIAPGRAGRIVRKCTAVNPDERYQTADALRSAL
jgi:serine/threonine protein kinase